MRTISRAGLVLALALASACQSGGGDPGGRPVASGPPSDMCGSVRLTSYTVTSRGWCEFPRNASFLPQFVRNGLTAAIAEPWNGGSYQGAPGEGCGECWEIDTVADPRIVMITDLCPVQGNPLCAGAHFHIDLSTEAAEVLDGGALDEGHARRVPCPVTGDVHVLVNDHEATYMRLAFMNHRIPLRSGEVKAAGPGAPADAPWIPLVRSGGAWEAIGQGMPLARGGTGVVFRLTSAQGQTVESSVIVPSMPPDGSTFDLGVQFDDIAPSEGGSCVYVPPGTIYADGWGGIDQVRWMINPWGAAENGFFGEVDENCYGGTGSCIRVSQLAQWTGFHLYYRQAFPRTTFSTVSLRLRTASGNGQVVVSPGNDGQRCTGTTVDVGPTYTEVTIDLASVCGSIMQLSSVTIENPGSTVALLVDDARFSP